MEDAQYKELLAMLVNIVKRIEKLEGRVGHTPIKGYVDELKKEAARVVDKLPDMP